MECTCGTRLYLPVTTTTGTSQETVTRGQEVGQPPCLSLEGTTGNVPLQLQDSSRPGVGVTSWGSWEKGQVGIENIGEVACARLSWECHQGHDPNVTKQERVRASSQARLVARALFSIP